MKPPKCDYCNNDATLWSMKWAICGECPDTKPPTNREYEFFPNDLKAQIPKLYSQEGSKDPIVYAKWFTPWTSWTWFITEGEDRDGDYLMFGYVIGQDREWGYISLNEIQSVTGPFGLKIERDIHFSPKKKSEIPDIP